jgi:hypothetical protein
MKKKSGKGPTQLIKEMALKAPGGVIRWYEARDAYLEGSESARRNERKGEQNYHMSLKQTLDRNFLKVGGTDGYYVLYQMTCGGDNTGDVVV